MGKDEVRAAARAKAAAAREAARRRRRRNRALAIGGGVVGVLAVGGIVTAVVVSSSSVPAAAVVSSTGRSSTPPWPAPADVEARISAAGLTPLTAEGTAEHIHQHLSITVNGKAVTVPADIGIDEAGQRISAIHTHDTSGIIHVESPQVKSFHLSQVFAEWDVALAPGRIGSYVNGHDGTKVAFFVGGHRYTKDPRELVLASHQDIDVAVTTNGSTPKAPAKKFVFPSGY